METVEIVTNYQIVTAYSPNQLEVLVNHELRLGWSVAGGPFVFYAQSDHSAPQAVFVQALTITVGSRI